METVYEDNNMRVEITDRKLVRVTLRHEKEEECPSAEIAIRKGPGRENRSIFITAGDDNSYVEPDSFCDKPALHIKRKEFFY